MAIGGNSTLKVVLSIATCHPSYGSSPFIPASEESSFQNQLLERKWERLFYSCYKGKQVTSPGKYCLAGVFLPFPIMSLPQTLVGEEDSRNLIYIFLLFS